MTLEPPRWKNGPGICPVENLPALPTLKELRAFKEANGPSCKTIHEWHCEACGHWHMKTSAPDPAGGSSGTGRGSKNKD